MRLYRVAVLLAALGLVAQAADARVPAFVRQTGMVCNQCHMSWTLAPDFTFTGMKFRINGYRTPWVAEKVEAGREGAINGQRLVLTLGSMLSWHTRGLVVGESKGATDPALPEATMSPPSSQVLSTIAMHYAGPIGEHVGIWNEFYMYGGLNTGHRNGYIGLSHYDVQVSTNAGGNIFGVGGSLLPAAGVHSFFGMTPSVAPNNQLHTPGVEGSGSPYAFYGAYAFLADRVGLKVGLEPGEDNLDYRRFNYRFEGGVFPLGNTDAGWLLLTFMLKAGNDMLPILTTLNPLNDGVRTLVPVDAVKGVSATRASGQPYVSASTGDAMRSLWTVGYGFVDHGPHSFIGTASFTLENENYTDGGHDRFRAWGTNLRYYYNRTYGIDLYLYKSASWKYTEPSGVVHSIPQDIGLDMRLVYRLAMNFALYLNLSNTQAQVLDQNWRNGFAWALNTQYLW